MGPGRLHPPGGVGSRSTGWEGGWDREGVNLRAEEARGPLGGRVRLGRRHPPGGGGSLSTRSEGATGEASSSSGRQRLTVHREEGATGEVKSSSGRRRLAVHREGGWDRGGVILRAAEASGPPGGWVGPARRHPPGGGGSRSTGREGGTGEAQSSGRRKLDFHREGGW